MCLIVFSYHHHSRYPLIIAANRDEFYERPTSPADFWEENPMILAGKDRKYGGTWMGITRSGRFAAVTNYREWEAQLDHALSRGLMVKEFLSGRQSPMHFLRRVTEGKERYNGFNLILGDLRKFFYYSNRKNGPEEIEAGIHVLSNHLLDTPWPKSVRSRKALSSLIEGGKEIGVDPLMEILRDRTLSDNDHLPDTGFGREWEKILSPVFIVSDIYGTRNCTAIIVDSLGHVTFAEQSFHHPEDPGAIVIHEFNLEQED